MSEVNRAGLKNSEVVAALVGGGRPVGRGILNPNANESRGAEAYAHLDGKAVRLDYVDGRPLKVDLDPKSDYFDALLYDRDNGQGAAERAILKAKQALGK